MKKNDNTGMLSTFVGGTLWGVNGVMGNYLFLHKNVITPWLIPYRLILAGFLLLGYLYYKKGSKIFDILKLVGMHPDHTNIKINTLSVSQKQRIALARALILDPQIIIIDDALGSLDATVKTQLTNLMLKLQEKFGLAYIYVGQHLGIIKHIADEVLVMEDGKMIEYGNTYSLFTAPKTDVTKRLIESHFGKILDESSWGDNLLATP